LILALGYGLARLWSVVPRGAVATRALLAAGGIGLGSLALHAGSRALFGHLPAPTPSRWVLAGASSVFVALFFFQALLWRANAHPIGRALYVHALNGFYVGTVANRLLNRLWPRADTRQTGDFQPHHE
jgi:NAD(P)H-quinone oxidoreductase subunit 5